MAVTGSIFNSTQATTSTAMLRALGTQVSAAIASAGMVKTTDTGQVDWTTVNWIGGSNQTWGYEVWRFNDALQATKPVFLKVYYSQTTQSNNLWMNAQVGTATDGAGNLGSAPNTNTSVTGQFQFCGASNTVSFGAAPWICYGDGSTLVFGCMTTQLTGSSNGFGGMLWVERARHTDGTPLGDGVSISGVYGTSPSILSQTVLQHNLLPQTGTFSSGMLPTVAAMPTSGVIGTNMYTFPWFTGFTPRLGAPSQMLIGYYRGDMVAGNTFVCDHYGAPRTFYALSPTVNYPFGFNNSGGTLAPALRIS